MAASLDGHPHIVTVYKWGEFEGSMYFVTELIDGISLAELLERQPGGRPLQPRGARACSRQIADALDFAHKRGAIHRDVKPANMMVKMTETPRTAFLVDFGITKMGDGDDRTAGDVPRHAGLRLARADLRRPGARPSRRRVLARLHGVRRADRAAAVRRRARTTRPASPPSCGRRVPSARRCAPSCRRAVDAVFAKALAKNREERYAQLRRVRPRAARRASRAARTVPPARPARRPTCRRRRCTRPTWRRGASGRGSSSASSSPCSPRRVAYFVDGDSRSRTIDVSRARTDDHHHDHDDNDDHDDDDDHDHHDDAPRRRPHRDLSD